MSFWDAKRVLVTGGSGFLGQFIVNKLRALGAEVFVPRSKEYNLIQFDDANRCMEVAKPQVVIHSAAFYGGIWINQMYPGRIYYENLVMGANVMEASRVAKIEKFVAIGTACSYPGYLENYLKEENLWDGIPHETVANYGLTKKMMAIQAWAYEKQYDFKSCHLILTNLYGPGDTYQIKRAHVVSALIRKFVEAHQQGNPEVEVWGTGKPIREFLYIEDCADAIIRAAEHYTDTTPMNIGLGEGTSIRELAELINDVVGYKGNMAWNTEKPDGQMKKVLDVSRMKEHLKWEPPTSLRAGLEKTIEWYIANKETADLRE